jgi:hypothetical protein
MAMLLPIFLPFNLLKGALNAAVTLLLYKPLVTALRRARFIAPTRGNAAASRKPSRGGAAMMIPAALVFITCALFLLAWAGII